MKEIRHPVRASIGIVLIALLPLFVSASLAHASSTEDGFAQKINEERSKHGLSNLAFDAGLIDIARSHSKRMAEADRLYHNTNLPDQVGDWEAIGENVGRGPNVAAIHQAFMASSSHRAQILGADYRGYAVGVHLQGDEIWVTEIFILRTASPVAPPTVKSSSSKKPAKARSVPSAPAPAPAPVVEFQPNERLISANPAARMLRHFLIEIPMWDGAFGGEKIPAPLVLATSMLMIGIAFTQGLLFSWPKIKR